MKNLGWDQWEWGGLEAHPRGEKQKGPVALLAIWPMQTAAVLTQLIAGWVSTRHKTTQAPPQKHTRMNKTLYPHNSSQNKFIQHLLTYSHEL